MKRSTPWPFRLLLAGWMPWAPALPAETVDGDGKQPLPAIVGVLAVGGEVLSLEQGTGLPFGSAGLVFAWARRRQVRHG